MYRKYIQKLRLETEKKDSRPTEVEREAVKNKSSTVPLPNNTLDEISIPVPRSLITQTMIDRGNKFNTTVDFKVTIKLEMKLKKRNKGVNASDTFPVFWGDMTKTYTTNAKVVRIFTSSTFTDTKFERNFWMENAYPQIKEFCQSRGYEFQVVDMRWGVRDEATDDHRGTELCLRELDQCQKLSTGPNFISMLSHKYGYTSLHREIDAAEFEALYDVMTPEQQRIISRWYIRDDNAVPPQYILQTISSLVPDYRSRDPEKKKAAKNEWFEESEAMQEALVVAAKSLHGEEGAMKYMISITHLEVQKGILHSTQPDAHCMWFKRTITDIETMDPSWQLSRFIECLGPTEKWNTSRKLLKNLKDNDMTKVLHEKNIFSYEIPWHGTGIDPANDVHAQYLKTMTSDFTTAMCEKINEAIENRKKSDTDEPVYEECLQHIEFCKAKANAVSRDDILEKIKNYIQGDSTQPLVIHGPSGIGKTSLMAMAACRVKEWTNNKSALIQRFIGTTFDSSHIIPFLKSIIINLKHAQHTYAFSPENLKEMVIEFHQSLNPIKVAVPVVFVLDSLDQFDPSNNARELFWLPFKLPPNIKIILSTLEDQKFEAFPILKRRIDPKNFIEVPALRSEEAENILKYWFQQKNRTVTDEQFSYLMKNFKEKPLSLYLKLISDEACLWTSYNRLDSLRLESSVRATIMKLFQRLEDQHGQLLVSHALGYLTIARTGLSEAELDDILSCDDEVLNDVYLYWTPPIRRLPPLLMVRIRSELMDNRYLGTKKPFVDNKGNNGAEDRRVTTQPLRIEDSYNIRKINNLPYHLTLAKLLDELKTECLFNFEFLLAVIQSTSLRKLHDDFDLAKSVFPEDESLKNVSQALRLSENALRYDPKSLCGQLLYRVDEQEGTASLLHQCRNSGYPYIMSSAEVSVKPGGDLMFVLSGHSGAIKDFSMTQCGKFVATVAEDDTMRIWDIHAGKEIKKIEGFGKIYGYVEYVAEDSIILVQTKQELVALSPDSSKVYTIKTASQRRSEPCVCVAGENKTDIAIVFHDKVDFYQAKSGKYYFTVEMPDGLISKKYLKTIDTSSFSEKVTFGSETYLAVTDEDKLKVSVIDVSRLIMTFGPVIYPFIDNADEEDRVVDYMAITKDGESLVLANAMKMDFVFYDIKTMIFTKIVKAAAEEICDTNFRITPDGSQLYYAAGKDVIGLDLKTEKYQSILKYTRTLTDVCTVDKETYVTLSNEKSLLVWKPDKTTMKNESAMGSHFVSAMHCMPNPRYVVLLVSVEIAQQSIPYIQLYDIVLRKVVRESRLTNAESQDDAKWNKLCKSRGLFDDRHLLISNSKGQLVVLDVYTMAITKRYHGYLNEKDLIKITAKKQVATGSTASKDITIYDYDTAKKAHVLTAPAQINSHLENLHASSGSKLMVAEYYDNKFIVVYDMEIRTLICVIECAHLTLSPHGCTYARKSPLDTTIALTVMGRPKGYKDLGPNNSKSTWYTYVWNLQKGMAVELFDRYDDVKYHILDEKKNLLQHFAEYLDDGRIATSHFDGVLRIWDVHTGTILSRIETNDDGADIITHPRSPYFLSYNMSDDDEIYQVWDKETLERVASYSLESTQYEPMFLENGLSFISRQDEHYPFIHWTIHGTKHQEDLTDFPILVKDNENSPVTHLVEVKTET